MKNIIEWLREVELLACEVYEKAALAFSEDPELKRFLEQNARDEAWHYHVMGSAATHVDSIPEIIPAISVDSETGERIINLLLEIKTGIAQDTLTKEKLIVNIIEAELSEWNAIFFYVINVIKEKASTFKYPAAALQAHLKRIESYLEAFNHLEAVSRITQLPPLWVEKILIVDDEEMITEVLCELLKKVADVDVAHNGRMALEMIHSQFYKLIISDINMPVMDGMTLYHDAVKQFSTLRNRFLFMTGEVSSDKADFFQQHNLTYLVKPFDISVLKAYAKKMILAR